MRIDAHQHFWIFNRERDAWITDDMAAIQRNFLPVDLAPVLKENEVDGVVAVQADQSTEETRFLVDLASMYAMVKGVVGWIDLQAEDIVDQLEEWKPFSIVKGFRHVIQGEEDPDFLIRPAFLRGMEALFSYDYTYDLLIHPRHYASTLACVAKFPGKRFVLDHMAKPNVRLQEFDEWAAFIQELASFPHVFCKISGLVTEADWQHWTLEDFKPYIAHVVACFGKDRVMFGSDWPVSLLAASYSDVMKVAEHGLADFTDEELTAFWGGNAQRFYNL